MKRILGITTHFVIKRMYVQIRDHKVSYHINANCNIIFVLICSVLESSADLEFDELSVNMN